MQLVHGIMLCEGTERERREEAWRAPPNQDSADDQQNKFCILSVCKVPAERQEKRRSTASRDTATIINSLRGDLWLSKNAQPFNGSSRLRFCLKLWRRAIARTNSMRPS